MGFMAKYLQSSLKIISASNLGDRGGGVFKPHIQHRSRKCFDRRSLSLSDSTKKGVLYAGSAAVPK
jgi:hypothetical protein